MAPRFRLSNLTVGLPFGQGPGAEVETPPRPGPMALVQPGDLTMVRAIVKVGETRHRFDIGVYEISGGISALDGLGKRAGPEPT